MRARTLPDGPGLRLEVEDTGPGVPAEQRHLLFRDFVQLASPVAMPHEIGIGTGLGLSIAAQLAELMGGRIGYLAGPVRGSVFWVELPLPPAAPPEAALAEPREAARLPQPGGLPLRVLVVDDVPANRLVARAMLTSAGHHVTCVEDGAAALAAVQQGQFDLVLMDLQMPVMDGLEATRRIRALPPPRGKVPVLAVTASAMPEQVEACRMAGMDGHLAKPIDRETLLRMVRQFAEAQPAGDAPPPRGPEPGPAAPLLDAEAGQALLADLGAAAAAVLTEFVAELERGRDSLKALAATPETGQLRVTVHRLLGVARTMGARRLARALEEIQRAVAQGQPTAEPLRDARQALQETLPALRAWLARQGQAGAG
ncbi:response regulator [Pseudoroseomonas cervicalis]|uniref:response regulator n=1 Tax=Teichococcus cervicalis TaxID=204525 RepID=UPI0035E64364